MSEKINKITYELRAILIYYHRNNFTIQSYIQIYYVFNVFKNFEEFKNV